jgi:hypothetical protein
MASSLGGARSILFAIATMMAACITNSSNLVFGAY